MKRSLFYPVSIILLIAAGCKSHFKTTTDKLTVSLHNQNIENGRNLAYNICAQCHYSKETGSFTGKQMKDLPSMLGKVYAANLTHFGAPANYSDAALFYLIKTGIAQDGRFIPYMVRPNIADEDLKDIIAYLRSDDKAVTGNQQTAGTTKLNLIGKIAMKFTGKPQPYQTNVHRPDANDKVAQGRYLVDNIGCFHCHSKSMLKLDLLHPEKSKGYMAGGAKFSVEGNKIYADNITKDATGIGRYSRDDFRQAIQTGIAPDKGKLQPPMPVFSHITNEQADGIYAYIQTLPAKENKVSKNKISTDKKKGK